MKQILKNKFLMLSIFIVFSLMMEICMFLMINNTVVPKYILLNICSTIIIGAFIFLFPSNKSSFIYLSVVLFIQMILNMLNCVMYDNSGDVFSILYIKLTKEAFRVFQFSFLNITKLFLFIVLFAVFITINIFLLKNVYIKEDKKKGMMLKKVLCFISSVVIFVSTYMGQVLYINAQNEDDVFGDSYLYSSLNLKVEGLKSFGTWGYYAKEVKNVLFTSSIPNANVLNEFNDYLAKGEIIKSDYFGVASDKNIIMIMMESFQWFAIDEELTPTLYGLANDGLSFTNSYSKNKTNISEMIGITGSYPSTKALDPKDVDYEIDVSILNLLDDSYVKTYVHPNTGEFYNREALMEKLGFDYTYFFDSIFPGEELYKWGEFALDSKTMENSLDYLVPEGAANFYSFFTTLSTHGPYNKSEKNNKLLESLGYFEKIDKAISDGKWVNPLSDSSASDSFRYYKAMAMDLDKAVEMLIERLKMKDLLDDTVLVLYGDHNAYYDDISYFVNDSKGGEYYKPYIFKTPLIIYNDDVTNAYKENNNMDSSEEVVIDKFASTYNIVPTLLDLLGIEFNSNLYLATSLFIEQDYDVLNVFFSLQGGIFNEHIYTNNGYDVVYSELEEYESELEVFREASKLMLYKLKYIEYIYNYNILKYMN